MHKTNITLDDWQYERLKAISEQEGRSVSEVLRAILDLHLREAASTPGNLGGLAAIRGIGSDPDASGRDHDRFLYGAP